MPDCEQWDYAWLCGTYGWHGPLGWCENATQAIQQDYPGFDSCGTVGLCVSINVHGELHHCHVSRECETPCYCRNESDPGGDYQFWPGVTADEAWTEHPILKPLLEDHCVKSACCYVDPQTCRVRCDMEYPYICLEDGGEPHHGKDCDPYVCEMEACCFCDAICVDMGYEACQRLGGVTPRRNTTCSNLPYYDNCYTNKTPCRYEPFGPAQILPEHERPDTPDYNPGAWAIASRKGLRATANEDDVKQHYGKIGSAFMFSNISHGWMCSRPTGGKRANGCPVVVQTEDDILGDPHIRPGYAALVCGYRCGCVTSPC